MRYLQSQVSKRTDTAGQPIKSPRLAQGERPQDEDPETQSSMRKKAKSAATKWIIGAIAGNAFAGGGIGYFILF